MEGSLYWTRKVVPVWSLWTWSWWPLSKRQFWQDDPSAAHWCWCTTRRRSARKARQLQVLSTMIKEVHHRVKNNLQTVASILRMQGRRTRQIPRCVYSSPRR